MFYGTASWAALGHRLSVISLCWLLLGCSTPLDTETSVGETQPVPTDPVLNDPALDAPALNDPALDDPAPSESSALSGPGQILPITAQAAVGSEVIQLEVAQTAEQQATGLMYRTALADNRGMLFPFESPRRTAFWMKNVPIALDMVFLLNGRVQAIQAEAPPCATEPCPVYGPSRLLVDQVIELRGGRAAELGLEPGDRIEISSLSETEPAER
ncbi:MAG: DUF192 domain-containing protein [Leptolyngbya sp. SIO4C1]|nr:DUF192 domain-containing protein [Leptolyngbya sp. SIO4C1]